MPLPTVETDTETKLAIIAENHRQSATEILLVYNSAQTWAQNSKDHAQMAIDEAVRCGAMLNAKKVEVERFNKGGWLVWVETYLPEIQRSIRTLQRWMQLAERTSHCDVLENTEPKSLRQAYIAVGIFPDPVVGQRNRLNNQSSTSKPSSAKSSLLSIINEFRAQKPIEALIQMTDFSGWDEVELATISRQLAPIVHAYSRLTHALSEKLKT